MDTPQRLVEQPSAIFPEFAEKWDGGESFGYCENYTYDSVLLNFTEVSHRLLNGATISRVKEFCALINHMVEDARGLFAFFLMSLALL